jgi:hypothetical protein
MAVLLFLMPKYNFKWRCVLGPRYIYTLLAEYHNKKTPRALAMSLHLNGLLCWDYS